MRLLQVSKGVDELSLRCATYISVSGYLLWRRPVPRPCRLQHMSICQLSMSRPIPPSVASFYFRYYSIAECDAPFAMFWNNGWSLIPVKSVILDIKAPLLLPQPVLRRLIR